MIENSQEKTENKICTSVFKNGAETTTKEDYTKKWIELINRMDKSLLESLALPIVRE